MATILEFRQDQRSTGTQRLKGVSAPAEIVFFPGVRYERREEAEQQKDKKRLRRRDRLEIDGTG